MQTVEKKIKELQDEINLWTSLLYPHIEKLKQLDFENFGSFFLSGGTRADDVSAEFAIEGLIAAIGRLSDVIIAAQSFWPNESEYFELELPMVGSYPNEIAETIKTKINTEDGLFWSTQLVLRRAEALNDILGSELSAIEPKELFALFHRWRRALAKSIVLESGFLTVTERMVGDKHWPKIFSDNLKQFDPSDRKLFRGAARRYLSSEFIFPWLADKYSPRASSYRNLFKLAEIELETVKMNMDAAIRDLWEDGAIEEGAIQQISQILSRIASSLKQIESYDDLIDQFIFGEEGQWGEDSMIGSSEPVNIIPCDHGNGSCREVLLAFAKGRRSPKQGLKSVMRQVREHMIRCNQTRIVIIFTDTWDLDVFSESFGDFQAHRECMPPKTIIGALVNGSRITPQSIG